MKHLFFNNIKEGHAQIFLVNPDKISYTCILSNNLQYNKILIKNLIFLGIYIPPRKLFIQSKMISCFSLNRPLGYAFCLLSEGSISTHWVCVTNPKLIHIYTAPSLLGLQAKEFKSTVTHLSLSSSVIKLFLTIGMIQSG